MKCAPISRCGSGPRQQQHLRLIRTRAGSLFGRQTPPSPDPNTRRGTAASCGHPSLSGSGWGGGGVRHQNQASECGRASAGVGEEGGVNPTDQFDSPTSAVQDAATYVSSSSSSSPPSPTSVSAVLRRLRCVRPAQVQHVRARLGPNLQSEALWSPLPQPEVPTLFFFFPTTF